MRLILPIILILASILIFIFGVNPLYKDVSDLKAEIGIYNTALSNSTSLQKAQSDLLTQYNQISKADKDRLEGFLPSSVNNIQFILEIERIASLHSMPIKDIKFETIKKTDNSGSNTIVSETQADTRRYSVFPLEFTTEGNYDSFLLFLKDLEYNLRLSDIKSISFSVPEDNGKPVDGLDPSMYRYTVKLETYWLK